GKPVNLQFGSVRWNEFRHCWIRIGVEQGSKSSHLGEVWYGEAPEITGPWRRVRKILTTISIPSTIRSSTIFSIRRTAVLFILKGPIPKLSPETNFQLHVMIIIKLCIDWIWQIRGSKLWHKTTE